MSNAEFGAYQDMLRQCEESMFGGDVQDDVETPVHVWIDAKRSPIVAKMVWVAVPNVVTCRYQTLLCYMDSDGQWRDNRGYLFSGKVNFWQYADVPECDVLC